MIKPKNLKAFILIFFSVVYLSSCSLGQQKRNKIIFEDSAPVVADSIASMVKLLNKLPVVDNRNYAIDLHGDFYLNNELIGNIEDLSDNDYFWNNQSLINFEESDKYQLLNLTAYLLYNHITGALYSPGARDFIFSYRRTRDYGYNDLRDIMYVRSEKELNNPSFERNYKVLDRNNHLVLIAPKDAIIR